MKIPNSVIYVVGDVLGSWYYSHSKLNTLFGGSGFPGDPPVGNCVHKSQEWLRRANQQDEQDPLELLGYSLTEFMNLGREDDANWTKGVKRISDALAKHRLSFDGDAVVMEATGRVEPNSLQIPNTHIQSTHKERLDTHKVPMEILTLPDERRGLQKIAGCNNPNRSLDIVFVHGLGGDSWTTWMSDVADIQTFWPGWLAEQFPQTGIWTLGYAASGSKWREESMPLSDRGNQVLDLLTNDGIGERPLVMITHSMGGIVAKQILHHAESFGVPRWERLARETRGIAFIATPHSGAHIANFAVLARAVYRTNEQVAELTAHDARLRELHGWFLNYQRKNGTVCRTYCERRVLRPEIPLLGIKLPSGVLVVDETSAEPNIAGERAIPLDEDHLSICRPLSRDAQIFKGMVRFVRDCEGPTDHPK